MISENTQSNENVEIKAELEQPKNQDDVYDYLNRDGFTSEIFKVEIRGLPKFYGISVRFSLFCILDYLKNCTKENYIFCLF